ncbi:MAG: hypothetical protein KF752_01115 [Pirellulaceae bacterium]|nr:hypothetical protein [Pirellulaceae bacterium]
MNASPTQWQAAPSVSDTISVCLAEMAPLLVHAANANKAWLSDFADDVVEIPRDLYEVLVAYRSLVSHRAA